MNVEGASAAQWRRGRRLRAAQKTPFMAAAAEYCPMTPEAGGRLAARGRPTPLVQVRPQGKVERHAEQVFEVPKIRLEDNIPQRTALQEPQPQADRGHSSS